MDIVTHPNPDFVRSVNLILIRGDISSIIPYTEMILWNPMMETVIQLNRTETENSSQTDR